MILYTFQPHTILEQLEKEKVLIANPNLGCHFEEDYSFKKPYGWLVEQYSKKIKNSQPSNYLWWAYNWRPDLRTFRHIYSGCDVLLKLDVPDEEVLMTNYNGWCGGLLNQCYIALSHWDDVYFEFYQKQLPFDLDPDKEYSFNDMDEYEQLILREVGAESLTLRDLRKSETVEKHPDQIVWDAHCQEHIEDSWQMIFDEDFAKRCEEGWILDSTLDQAVFEWLKLDYVIDVIRFKSSSK
jgi:hypothetical protein